MSLFIHLKCITAASNIYLPFLQAFVWSCCCLFTTHTTLCHCNQLCCSLFEKELCLVLVSTYVGVRMLCNVQCVDKSKRELSS